MQASVKTLLVAVLLMAVPAAVRADFYTQLNGPGQTFLYFGQSSALSVFDTNPVTPPDLPLAAIAFDNFTLTETSSLNTLQWSGAYEDGAPANKRADAFQITFYSDNAGAVGAQIMQFVAPFASVNETALGGNHFGYTFAAPLGSLVFDSGVKYWMSVVAEIPYNTPSPIGNAWGWAFNNSGDADSWQYTQTGPVVGGVYSYEQFNDPIDYSFSIQTTAVPEPSSCLLLAGAIGGVAVRKWRKRRAAGTK